jgi:outer membrane protein assembly factor BamB
LPTVLACTKGIGVDVRDVLVHPVADLFRRSSVTCWRRNEPCRSNVEQAAESGGLEVLGFTVKHMQLRSEGNMSIAQSNQPTPRKPLRLWPGVTAAVLLLLVRFALPVVMPDAAIFGVIGGPVGALAIIVWWLFFSRAAWSDRLGAIVVMIVALLATSRIVHPSIAGGMMGMMLPIYAIPVLSLALVASAVVGRRLSTGARRASTVAAILLASGMFTLLRTDGVIGAGSDLHWRWTKTAEERLLAQVGDDPAPLPPVPATTDTPREPVSATREDKSVPSAPSGPTTPATAPATKPEPAAPPAVTPILWPGFRGPERDGIISGVRIETDWAKSPPLELWRRRIGPGWSSFAVAGDLLYTQEQRGGDEIVASYNASTGKPVWKHRDAVRFWESNAGAGPRATPTVSNGRVYSLGATGIVNALDAASGAVVWSRNAASDTGRQIPDWGFASSPLVIDGVVVIAVAGQLVAYDIRTGNPRWFGSPEGGGYSSPHLVTIDGVAQILLMRGRRTTSFAPADGTVLWEHSADAVVSIVQPALAGDGVVLIAGGDTMGGGGIRRLAVAHGSAGWSVEERWTSRGLKPYFNDFVVHKGHAFGFDGSILACIDLEDGTRKWKGGRYGSGQLVLLRDQDLLLVLSEEGELALVRAVPDQFTELARFPAIEGKTWNHPVLVHDLLLVRNGDEMAAFRLSVAGAEAHR